VAIGDAFLAAVLTYGYPALGLMIFLGSFGLPLPHGIAVTVAGSLAAQGKIDWLWAGAATAAASVLGDIAGYALGRVLDRGVLERRGRWLGYTRERALRIKRLFEQWGVWTLLITRTFVSYLSPAVNLLAGAAGYRLTVFLALTLLGRLLWTSAYLGLGYAVGSDPEAASGFLANLSGLLVSLAVLAASWLVASGRARLPIRNSSAA
jgi:membrane protein DedA with SNARE-associated domain